MLQHLIIGNEASPLCCVCVQALLSAPPADPDACRRVDLTHLAVYTVDDASTTEVDDGLSVTTDEQGNRLFWVHVADPTRWITPGRNTCPLQQSTGSSWLQCGRLLNYQHNLMLNTACTTGFAEVPSTNMLSSMFWLPMPFLLLVLAGDLFDVEARNRSRTLYFPFGAVPMFPRVLAEGPFSLGSAGSSSVGDGDAPGTCCAFSVCASLNPDGSLGHILRITPSTITVSHRLTYDAVDADLGLGPGMCQYEDLQLIYEAARLR